eukprot:CAMPEP_0114346874 /NCGR_PEP_ID=MMETSP0101-20121206/13430_1 /TAXON_ID=38822 ORGANISM="Pteridomonas danica, Strain PT" /NCGR_SAMPLE_ID=MMETSP0101 /ASSEMBLY_ACC=CAM_ASM_000211 /LENGTH=137 /DNA_ID=CAMNT_0001483807 /DNA_START=332 /DNA_END=743 /DNA_ORIENTATION=-
MAEASNDGVVVVAVVIFAMLVFKKLVRWISSPSTNILDKKKRQGSVSKHQLAHYGGLLLPASINSKIDSDKMMMLMMMLMMMKVMKVMKEKIIKMAMMIKIKNENETMDGIEYDVDDDENDDDDVDGVTIPTIKGVG